MFGLGPATRIYVALGATDMRKGYDGLYGIVRDKLGLEVRSGHLFLFTNAVAFNGISGNGRHFEPGGSEKVSGFNVRSGRLSVRQRVTARCEQKPVTF